MLFPATSPSFQGNKFHNKNMSCVWWRCQDFQMIITEWHITSGSYRPTGFVFHFTAVQKPLGVLHSWHSKDVMSDWCTSTRQESTKNFMDIFFWETHPIVQTHHYTWNLFCSISGNMLLKEVGRWQVSIPQGCSSVKQWFLCWWLINL